MEQPLKNTHKHLFLLVGLIVVLLILGGVWSWAKEKTASLETTQTNSQEQVKTQTQELKSEQKITQQLPPVSVPETIEWHQLSRAGIIKTTPAVKTWNGYDSIFYVFNIGDIKTGEYKGKNIALAISKGAYEDYEPRENLVHYFGYFVSDSQGNVIAWDKDLIFDPDNCLSSPDAAPNYAGEGGVSLGCDEFLAKDQLGLQDSLQKSLSVIPKEFGKIEYLKTAGKQAFYRVFTGSLMSNNDTFYNSTSVDKTSSGFSVLRGLANRSSSAALMPEVAYFILLPFNLKIQISPEPNFVDQNDVPQLAWNTGTTQLASYRYSTYAYGWEDCYDGISNVELQSVLIQTGTTSKGDPVYEVSPTQYPDVYACLHEKTKRYEYDPVTGRGIYEPTISYTDFIKTHPMFFWRHQSGDLMAFIRGDVVPAAEKAKPVVYLYPEKTEKISVKVAPVGGFTITIPEYGNGWDVTATPEGVITNIQDGVQYPYLFWEGGKEGVVETPKEGFVVTKENVSKTLDEKLSLFGLNEQERADFLEFWVPKLSHAPYYFVTFISRSEIDRVAPMTISPRAESTIRVLMDYKPLNEPISVEPLTILPTERKGFTVVEWGGIIRD